MTTNYQPRNFSPEQTAKLKNVIQEGLNVMSEIESLKGGLSDTIKAVAEEFELKPSLLQKAIKTAMKNDFDAAEEDLNIVEDILKTVGRR